MNLRGTTWMLAGVLLGACDAPRERAHDAELGPAPLPSIAASARGAPARYRFECSEDGCHAVLEPLSPENDAASTGTPPPAPRREATACVQELEPGESLTMTGSVCLRSSPEATRNVIVRCPSILIDWQEELRKP